MSCFNVPDKEKHLRLFGSLGTELSGSKEMSTLLEIIESLVLEGTFKGRLIQLPCNEQGHAQQDLVAQGFIQSHPESLQGWAINNNSGQPVPVHHHPHIYFSLLD